MAISVYTEITDERGAATHGSIFYDGACPCCCRWVRRVAPILLPRGFAFIPLQDSRATCLFHLDGERLLDEMRLLMSTGEAFGGADAIIEVARHVWWAWPLVALARIPGMRSILRAAYRHIAAQRYCSGGACPAPARIGIGANRNHSRSAS